MDMLETKIKMTVSYPDGSVFDELVSPFVVRHRYPFKMRTGKLMRPSKIVLEAPESVADEVNEYLGAFLPRILHPLDYDEVVVNPVCY